MTERPRRFEICNTRENRRDFREAIRADGDMWTRLGVKRGVPYRRQLQRLEQRVRSLDEGRRDRWIEPPAGAAFDKGARGAPAGDPKVDLGFVRDRQNACSDVDRVATETAWAALAVPSFVHVAHAAGHGGRETEPLRTVDHGLAISALHAVAECLAARGHRRDGAHRAQPAAAKRCRLAHGGERVAEVDLRHRATQGVVVGEHPRRFIGVGAASDESQQ